MANVLEKIVLDKREAVEELKKAKPLSNFIDDLVPSKKDLYGALKRSNSKPEAGFILECKKASPSKGLIRPDFDVKSICRQYDKYAAGISVLTDEKYFQGSYDYLKIVTDTVTCPVLNKDFFIDPYQVYLARYYGADAILLMLSVLDDEKYLELAAIAEQYNLAILTEISNEQERDRAIALGAKLIGINNRNLRDLSTDIGRTFDLAPSIPDDRIIISESGIYTNAQIRELAPAVDGFLVGSSIMAEEDIDLACRKLVFGNNKVCGLTAPEYAQAAADAGARFGGLIFAGKSPRCIDTAQAQAIIEQVPQLDYVGVFVNHDIFEVAELAGSLNLRAVQLHGGESPDYIRALKDKLPAQCQLWQASAVVDEVPQLSEQADHFVLDGKNAGSGQAFNWQTLTASEQDLSKALLAGGLNSDNIEQALKQLCNQDLFGLDLNSGVESSPGVKDSAKLQQVFARIRNY
ncbi:bifunctional indole-3-glycerol-phosphate synthase TrpC/phosphoribosylanthranilate isomerase TrpF [Thalassomonas actiniarum]|uniref:Multifunctional fusion protein n=1 Tax=Thalassomonas actiniarum TaxID=485447 RepID=A0AAE9YL19_9GAMM|nr:bifunctional indole-3-glycerol-phosphate synthase TrpC/phosphoribosylanthranilate isomerase TrpF [Thalassomonas actiniarum]WDD97126.1 bifunctional indole-3-glycerol-phosphate synthase TrpC/phosphoribosylanthranilate isomerase TrpF [Thalassomonas actiniarum]